MSREYPGEWEMLGHMRGKDGTSSHLYPSIKYMAWGKNGTEQLWQHSPVSPIR